MKLVGSDVTFGIAGAPACFKDIDFEGSIDMEDVTSNCSDRYQSRPKSNTRRARITASDFVEADSNANFIDMCVEGEVVDVDSFTGLTQTRLDFYKPWVCVRSSLRHNRTDSSENSIELEGTGGGYVVAPAVP